MSCGRIDVATLSQAKVYAKIPVPVFCASFITKWQKSKGHILSCCTLQENANGCNNTCSSLVFLLFIMQQTAALAMNQKSAKKAWLYACVPTTINTYCEFMSPFPLSCKDSSSFPTCKWAVGWSKHPTWRDVVYCRENPGHREAMIKGPDTSHHVLNVLDLHSTLSFPLAHAFFYFFLFSNFPLLQPLQRDRDDFQYMVSLGCM